MDGHSVLSMKRRRQRGSTFSHAGRVMKMLPPTCRGTDFALPAKVHCAKLLPATFKDALLLGGTLMQVGCCQGSCCAAVWNGLYTCITSAVRRSVCSQSSHSGSVVSTVALQIKKDPGWRHSTGLFYMESMGVSSNCPRTCKWDRLRAPMGDYS